MMHMSESVHWFWNYDNVKSLTPKSVILRNRQIKFSLHRSYWRVACFKHLLITLIKFLCAKQAYFSDVEKTGETDFIEKPKSIYISYDTPFGESSCTKKRTSSNVTHFRRKGHIFTTLKRKKTVFSGITWKKPCPMDLLLPRMDYHFFFFLCVPP